MTQLKYPPPRYEVIGKQQYRSLEDYVWKDPKNGKLIVIPKGTVSDGASGAYDVFGASWWVHDAICVDPHYEDGTPIGAHNAARILSHILRANGRLFRSVSWYVATYFFGCKNARKNGWFK